MPYFSASTLFRGQGCKCRMWRSSPLRLKYCDQHLARSNTWVGKVRGGGEGENKRSDMGEVSDVTQLPTAVLLLKHLAKSRGCREAKGLA